MTACNREAAVRFFQCYRSAGVNPLRHQTGFSQLRRQRHGKAAGVGRSDELLGICAGSLLKTGAEGIWRVRQNTAGGRDCALSAFQITLPDSRRCAFHHVLMGPVAAISNTTFTAGIGVQETRGNWIACSNGAATKTRREFPAPRASGAFQRPVVAPSVLQSGAP